MAHYRSHEAPPVCTHMEKKMQHSILHDENQKSNENLSPFLDLLQYQNLEKETSVVEPCAISRSTIF